MFRIATLIVLLGCCKSGLAQIEQIIGAKAAVFGGFGSAGNAEASVLLTNPAGMAGVNTFSATIAAGQPFFLEALNTAALAAVLPFQNHYVGFSAYSRGNNLFRQTQVSAAYAISLFENKFRGGVKLGGYNTNIPEYGTQTCWIIDAGLQTTISKSIDIGVRVTNLNQAQLKINREEPLPTVLAAGVLWKIGKTFAAGAEVVQNSTWPTDLRFGLEYKPHPILAIRIGTRTEPFVYIAGIGINWKSYQLDVAMEHHLMLGFTPQLSFSYLVNRPNDAEKKQQKP